jgi:hypothetical protein
LLAGVEQPIVAAGHADSVDPQQGAVQDHIGLSAGDLDGLVQGGCHRGQHLEQ